MSEPLRSGAATTALLCGLLCRLLSCVMNLRPRTAATAEDELYLLQHKRIRENHLFAAAQCNDVEAIQILHKQGVTDFRQRGVLGETALHVAVQCENVAAALALLDADSTLINEPMTSTLFNGQTALHISVLNQNVALTKHLLARGADAVSPRATGSYFADKRRKHAGYGEYVLSFAASTGNLEIVRLLLKHRVRVDAQDSRGNTVLHTLVLHKHRIIACQMYDFILANTQGGQGDVNPESILNHRNYTPLKLAAAKGNVVLFRHLVKRRRVVQWSVGTVTSTLYDVSEIDSLEDDHSVLHIITTSRKSQARQILEITPVKELANIKWARYGRRYFYVWTMLYMVYIVIFTLSCIYRPLMPRTDNVTDPRDDVILVQRPLSECYRTQQDLVRLCGEIASIVGAIVIFVIEMLDVIRVGASRYFGNIVTGGHFHLILVCYTCLVGLLFVMRLSGLQGESVPMSLALVLGWCYTLFFAHGVQMLGPIMVTIQKILFDDVFRVCCLMFMVLMGFTCAFRITFQVLNPNDWNQWHDLYTAWFTMYQLFLGLVSHWFNVNINFSDFIKVVYTFYMIFAFVLMINLLIAVVKSTYSRMVLEKEQLWRTQVAATTQLLERRLPRHLRYHAGISGKSYELGDRRFLRIEDRNERAVQKVKRYAMAFKKGHSGSVEDIGRGPEEEALGGNFTRSSAKQPQQQQPHPQPVPPTIVASGSEASCAQQPEFVYQI